MSDESYSLQTPLGEVRVHPSERRAVLEEDLYDLVEPILSKLETIANLPVTITSSYLDPVMDLLELVYESKIAAISVSTLGLIYLLVSRGFEIGRLVIAEASATAVAATTATATVTTESSPEQETEDEEGSTPTIYRMAGPNLGSPATPTL